MTTRLHEVMKEIWNREEYDRPSNPINQRHTIEKAHKGSQIQLDEYPVDIDRIKTVSRDRLAPSILVQLPTYSLAAAVALTILLPRYSRQLHIQNNSDIGLSPPNDNVSISMDGTPAMAGDYTIRPGVERDWDVYILQISLYSPTAMTINGSLLGGIWLGVST